jgi:hypothetical protein
MIGRGLFMAILLAVLLVIAVRLNEIERRLEAKAESKASADSLSKERFDSEMRELHDVKVGLNTLSAWYQEDARMLLIRKAEAAK